MQDLVNRFLSKILQDHARKMVNKLKQDHLARSMISKILQDILIRPGKINNTKNKQDDLIRLSWRVMLLLVKHFRSTLTVTPLVTPLYKRIIVIKNAYLIY